MKTLTPAFMAAIRPSEQAYVAAVKKHNPTFTSAGDQHPEIVRTLAAYRAAKKAAEHLKGKAW